MFFLIKETLEEVDMEKWLGAKEQYVSVLSLEEWRKLKDNFNMGIDMEPDFT